MKKRLILIVLGLALLLAACGDGSDSWDGPLPEGDAADGEKVYSQLCIACHGAGGVGVDGLGKSITTSEFVSASSDEELVKFIETGRAIDHPDNTTGVEMPPKGGNPALKLQDAVNAIAYMRSIQE